MLVSFFIYFPLFLITLGFYPMSIFLILNKFNKEKFFTNTQLLIISLALSPFLVSLLLYYFLFLLPQKSAYFYISTIGLIGIIPVFFLRISVFYHAIKSITAKFKFVLSGTEIKKSSYTIDNTQFNLSGRKLFYFLTVSIFAINGFYQSSRPISGHDMLEYAEQGRLYAMTKKITYEEHHFNSTNSFYYVGLHGLSFPLLKTWDSLFADLFYVQDRDFFFRSVSILYFFIIYLFGLTMLSSFPLNHSIAWFSFIFLPFGINSFLMGPHIDSYRIAMLSLSVYLLWRAVQTPKMLLIVLFAIFVSAQAYIHSLGVFLACIFFLSFLVFSRASFANKLLLAGFLFILFMLLGNIHYVIDTFEGTGWIFKEIKYY